MNRDPSPQCTQPNFTPLFCDDIPGARSSKKGCGKGLSEPNIFRRPRHRSHQVTHPYLLEMLSKILSRTASCAHFASAPLRAHGALPKVAMPAMASALAMPTLPARPFSATTAGKEKILLLYSGGLDTSVILHYLIEQGHEVVCYMGNLVQDEDFEYAKEKAKKIGAIDCVVGDLRETFM